MLVEFVSLIELVEFAIKVNSSAGQVNETRSVSRTGRVERAS